ncbi:hypothetical protein SKAU_G00120400 [Synaphobranchus kaupii]|uniref:Uncharacterized protein n=1 Tax=Synaphobranchus kaupii TaxID=118154 RepID=A0A9Q1FNR5_SYNKA|nr:hypothetical protein SKAU_G00120400 [Synaphobranchus kaupii]
MALANNEMRLREVQTRVIQDHDIFNNINVVSLAIASRPRIERETGFHGEPPARAGGVRRSRGARHCGNSNPILSVLSAIAVLLNCDLDPQSTEHVSRLRTDTLSLRTSAGLTCSVSAGKPSDRGETDGRFTSNWSSVRKRLESVPLKRDLFMMKSAHIYFSCHIWTFPALCPRIAVLRGTVEWDLKEKIASDPIPSDG